MRRVVLSDDGGRAEVKYSQAGDVLFRAVPGYLVLVHLDGVAVEVQGPGADIWHAITRPTLLDRIVDDMASRYSADRLTVRDDVLRLLASLEELGYVRRTC